MANFVYPISRPDLPYINIPAPNDDYFSLLEKLNRSITGEMLDGTFNFFTDVMNDLYDISQSITAGLIPGSNLPENANRFLTTDGNPQPNLSWVLIDSNNIAPNAITSDLIAANSVGTQQLQDGCVTGRKIAIGTIDIDNMNDNSIGTNQIVNGSVTIDKLAPNIQIGTNQIVNGSVTQPKIAISAIGTPQLADGSVGTNQLANGGITNEKIQNGSINYEKLNPASVSAVPTGVIVPYTSAVVPAGYIRPYGQALSRVVFANLFAVMGTTFGAGDGNTTFNVPDLRGRTMVGIGGAVINDTNGLITNATVNAVTIGGNGGSEQVTLTVPQIPAHTHDYDRTITQAIVGLVNLQGNVTISNNVQVSPTTATGGGQPHANLQPSILIPFILKT
jgi:microcystin-dependent protein